jgi:hypothetical protein
VTKDRAAPPEVTDSLLQESPIQQSATLWSPQFAEQLVKHLANRLQGVADNWGAHNPGNYCSQLMIGAESDDPLANAVLWLAFVHDYLQHILDAHAGRISKSPLKFDELAQRFGIAGANAGEPVQKEYWEARLRILERLNERYFPDHHLLAAWKLYLRMLNKPALRRKADSFGLAEHGFWAQAISADVRAQVGWWVETNRQWHECPPMARMWLAPLLLEAVFETGVYKRTLPWSRYRDGIPLSVFFSALEGYPKSENPQQSELHQRELSVIERIARAAIFGFPLRVPPTANASEHATDERLPNVDPDAAHSPLEENPVERPSPSWLIRSMQQNWPS